MGITERYVTSTGTDTYANSTNPATPMSLATAIASGVAGDRINIKAGTYTQAGALTLNTAGTTASPIIWRGYTTTIGDAIRGRINGGALDDSLMPVIDMATFLFTVNQIGIIIAGIKFISNRSGTTVSVGFFTDVLYNCVVINSSTNAAAVAIDSGGPVILCDATVTGAAGAGCYAAACTKLLFSRLKCTNGTFVTKIAFTNTYLAVGNVLFGSAAAIGFGGTGAWGGTFINNTVHGCVDGFQTPNTASATNLGILINNHITDCSGKGMNSLFATDLAAFRVCPRTRDNAGGADVGFADWIAASNFGAVTTDAAPGDATQDFVDASNGDFRLIAAAPGKGVGIIPFYDIGALQIQGFGATDVNVVSIAAGAITAAAIADGAVDAATFASGAINAAALAADAVTKIRATVTGSAQSGSTTTLVDSARTEASNDYWKGSRIQFTSGANIGIVRGITAFVASTDTLTFYPPLPNAIVSGVAYSIIGASDLDSLVVDSGILAAVLGLTATLPSTSSAVLNFYARCRLQIVSGTGVGQERTIISGTTGRVQTIDSAWATAPDTTSGYRILVDSVMPVDLIRVNGTTPTLLSVVDANVVSWLGIGAGALRNVQLDNLMFPMKLSADHVTLATGKTITATRVIDGGNFAPCVNAATEILNADLTPSGRYRTNVAAADMNGGTIMLSFAAPNCDTVTLTIITKATAA